MGTSDSCGFCHCRKSLKHLFIMVDTSEKELFTAHAQRRRLSRAGVECLRSYFFQLPHIHIQYTQVIHLNTVFSARTYNYTDFNKLLYLLLVSLQLYNALYDFKNTDNLQIGDSSFLQTSPTGDNLWAWFINMHEIAQADPFTLGVCMELAYNKQNFTLKYHPVINLTVCK